MSTGRQAGRCQISLFYEMEGAYFLNGDPNLLEQALINLLLNALQASPPSAEVRIVVKKVGMVVAIEVHDEGEGIDSDDMEHIFDPFFSTRQADGGSGLGLSISLGIVQQHGGELSLRNRPQRGVSATIFLPLAMAGNDAVTDGVCDSV